MEQRKTELIAQIACVLPSNEHLVLEIGCGHGHFLVAYAQAHPSACCIGIDLVSERITRAIRKRDHASLSNVHFIRADAQLFLESLPDHEKISDVYLLFPDPWPKQRHHKHRIMQPTFLDALARRAGRGMRLFFRTDYRPYFDDAEAALRDHPRWLIAPEPWPFEHETVFQRRAPNFCSLVARVRPPRP